MAKTIEMIEEYIIKQDEGGEYNPPSYIWHDNKGELIRCRDCRFLNKGECEHNFGLLVANDDDYCSLAERKEENETD